jgi:phosphoribosylamine---glycine ligase
MTRFLFVSKEGAIPDLALTVKNEGHQVRMSILDHAEQEVGNGFVDKVEDWRSHIDWPDIIVFDYAEFGPDIQQLRRRGKCVVGGTEYTDRLEMDREFAQNEMKEAGLDTLPRRTFDSFDDAVTFLRNHPQRVVIKPSGSAQSEKVLTFIGQDESGRDVIDLLGKLKKGWANKISSFQLQQHVTGVEVAVGGFFNGKKFLLPACVNFEHKRMFTGEIGPTTGEMGTLCFWDSKSRLVKEGLLAMESKLADAGYRGYFDINFIATADRLRPLEVTPRFGYPTINVQIEGVPSSWGRLLAGLACGNDAPLSPKRGFQVGVVVAVPPFPFVDPASFGKYSKDAVVVFKNGDRAGVHPCDVKLVDDDWLLTGTAGYAVVVTGAGETVEEACEEAYGRIYNLIIPNMFYRTDIGSRWRRDADLLSSWGYLR